MKLATKIILFFSLALVIASIISVSSYYVIEDLNSQYQELLSNDVSHDIKRQLYQVSQEHQNLVVVISVFLIFGGVITALLMGKALLLPLYLIEHTAKSIGKGQLDTRIPIYSDDELGKISETLNRMAEDLAKTTISKEYFNSILHAMTDSLIVTNLEGTIQSVNPAGLKLLGYEEEDILGKKLDLVSDEINWPENGSIDELLVSGIIAHNVEHLYNQQSGTKVPVLYSGTVIMNDVQQCIGVACIARDISQQKQVETELAKEHQYLISIIDTISEGIIVTDQYGQVVLANKRAQEFIGLDESRILNANLDSLNVFSDDKTKDASLSKMDGLEREDGMYYPELNCTASNNQIYYLEGSTHKFVQNEEVKGSVFVLSDISIHKCAREHLLRAKEAAELANRTKSDFLAIMSHEIRTPLIGVLGVTDLLEETELSMEQESLVKTAHRSGTQLLLLINDILDFSKIESGKLELEDTEFLLCEMFEDLYLMFKEQAQMKNITLIFDIAPELEVLVTGDETRIRQILTNLIGNAIKFTEDGSVTLQVKVKDTSKDNMHVVFSVIDTGIGIENNKQAGLFDAFTQAESSTTRKYGGSGLGLAICKHLVELMDGEIGIMSTVGHGSTFWFNLNMHVVSTSNIQPKKDKENALTPLSLTQRIRVLLAEDNHVNQTIACKMLSKMNCDVVVAENGQVALDYYKEGDFDIILMDCQMPVLNGFDASVAIRKFELENNLGRTPIVSLTASVTGEARQECLNHGMDDYLSKPYSKHQLKDILEVWVLPELTEETTVIKEQITQTKSAQMNDSGTKVSLNHIQQIIDDTNINIQDVIALLSNDLNEHIERLNEAIDAKDLEKIKEISFRISLSAKQIGADELDNIAKILYEIVKSDPTHEVLNALKKSLEASFNHTLSQLDYQAVS